MKFTGMHYSLMVFVGFVISVGDERARSIKTLIKITLIHFFSYSLLIFLLWNRLLRKRKARPNLTILIAYNAKLD